MNHQPMYLLYTYYCLHNKIINSDLFCMHLQNTINRLMSQAMLASNSSRRRFNLDVLNLHKSGLQKISKWGPNDGFDDLIVQFSNIFLCNQLKYMSSCRYTYLVNP